MENNQSSKKKAGTKRKIDSKLTIKDQLKHICQNPECPQHKIDSSVTDFQFSKGLCDKCLLCGKSAIFLCPATGDFHRRSYFSKNNFGYFVRNTEPRKKKRFNNDLQVNNILDVEVIDLISNESYSKDEKKHSIEVFTKNDSIIATDTSFNEEEDEDEEEKEEEIVDETQNTIVLSDFLCSPLNFEIDENDIFSFPNFDFEYGCKKIEEDKPDKKEEDIN
jgi:hypothetical protein